MILGLVVAFLAFVGVFLVGTSTGRPAQVAQVSVVAAARDIQARETLTPDMLVMASVPVNALPAGAETSMGSVKGQIALVGILKGQVLTTNVVAPSADSAAAPVSYLPIPPGFVARAIPTGEQQGVAGYVAVGDYINVIATVNTNLFGDAASKQVTKLVFANLHVIRVGPATPGKAGQTQGVSSSLTVVMSACDAEMMDWLLANTKITYVLLSYKDYTSPQTARDPKCPTVDPTSGIGPTQVNARYGFTRV